MAEFKLINDKKPFLFKDLKIGSFFICVTTKGLSPGSIFMKIDEYVHKGSSFNCVCVFAIKSHERADVPGKVYYISNPSQVCEVVPEADEVVFRKI